VEAYARVSLPDLEVEAAANVWAFTSLPVLDVEVSANVGTSSTSLVIVQTTGTTTGRSVGHASAPVASGVPPGPHQSDVALATPPLLAEASAVDEDLSVVYLYRIANTTNIEPSPLKSRLYMLATLRQSWSDARRCKRT